MSKSTTPATQQALAFFGKRGPRRRCRTTVQVIPHLTEAMTRATPESGGTYWRKVWRSWCKIPTDRAVVFLAEALSKATDTTSARDFCAGRVRSRRPTVIRTGRARSSSLTAPMRATSPDPFAALGDGAARMILVFPTNRGTGLPGTCRHHDQDVRPVRPVEFLTVRKTTITNAERLTLNRIGLVIKLLVDVLPRLLFLTTGASWRSW